MYKFLVHRTNASAMHTQLYSFIAYICATLDTISTKIAMWNIKGHEVAKVTKTALLGTWKISRTCTCGLESILTNSAGIWCAIIIKAEN
jgi:hypothetical protein